ncbi:MAG: SRPBCC family protein [Balneolaceae bacterium]
MNSENEPVAAFEMLIRKPSGEVFEALANPEITSKFWFTKGSARLEAGKTVTWEWDQFGIEAEIIVNEVKPGRLIRFHWPAGEKDSDYRSVKISFEPKSDDTTFVRVVEEGFDKNDKQLVEQVAGQTGGWALVLSAMKAWLEHGIDLNVVSDHHPE